MKWRYLLLSSLLTFCTSPEPEDTESEHLLEPITIPASENSSLPHLIKVADNKLYLSWVEKRDSNMVDFKYAQLNDSGWSEPELIASGNDWFVNWADYPMIAVDSNGNKIASYLAKSSSGTYSYDVNLVLKPDTAAQWSAPIIPHKDGTPTEHGFVTMLPNNDGSFLLSWLDGRNTGGEGHGDHGSGGAMTIRSAVINMQGQISEEAELDGRVCDYCQTGGVITPEGSIIVYRDRSVDEVRDMAFIIKSDGSWSEPKLVAEDNWNIAGCPVNGPRIAGFGNTVATAWYTSALNRPKVKVAFKTAETFKEPIIVDDTSPVGRVDVGMINEQTAIVSWMDGGEAPAIKYRIVNQNGSMSSVKTVAEISESRGSGFPQMEVFEGYIYFAWTEVKNEQPVIRLSNVKLTI